MDDKNKATNASDTSSETDSTEVPENTAGYGNPPLQRRFKKGVSGNEKGRPRGSKNRKKIVREIANEMHTVTEDGQRRRRSTLELMLLALRNRAAEGNVRVFRAFQKYLAKYEPQETNSKLGVLVAPAGMTAEEWIENSKKKSAKADALHEARSRELLRKP